MTTLIWPIKQSLIEYVRGMADGTAEAAHGAVATDQGFEFPGSPEADLAFRGTVTLTGHSGMLHLVFRDPALVRGDDGWVLTIADPDDPAIRLPFARIASLTQEGGGRRASGSALTADGADLFFGPYVEGTPVDDPFVRD
ncbi:HtaA domain-containing protein [Agromyces sp. NPDC058484]|uniref:HtaA domain-containing protein n=1 Tax=Agromyces sp. NPDC058484 TaxID=3346524 RepID=UPI0036537BC0